MEFPELEASGLAKVKSIEPCPPIAQGEGHAVTSRIITRQAKELVEIEIEGGETLTGTPLHPIWIIEAQDWINLEEVEPGQHVWTEDGPLEITSSDYSRLLKASIISKFMVSTFTKLLTLEYWCTTSLMLENLADTILQTSAPLFQFC